LDRARERIPADHRDDRLLQRVLGRRNLTRQPDSDPSREPWIRYEHVMDDETSIASYGESLANFGAAYVATQESMKSQATTMATMQGQLVNIQQFCMAVNQQPPPTIYSPPQQQQHNNCRSNRRNGGSGGANGTGSFPGLAAMVPARNSLRALPHPTSIRRIGITAAPMVATSTTPTQA
jgi:hypothetical protein